VISPKGPCSTRDLAPSSSDWERTPVGIASSSRMASPKGEPTRQHGGSTATAKRRNEYVCPYTRIDHEYDGLAQKALESRPSEVLGFFRRGKWGG